jgi:virulence factor Mce-like protein
VIDVRDRLTERVNRARIQLEARRAVRPLVVIALCGVLGLALMALVVSKVAPNLLSDTYEAKFELADATALTPGLHDVRLKGIPAGEVTKVAFEGNRPVATVRIQKEYGEIYRDVRAQLRPTTALQDMYLDIVDRGTPRAGKATADEPIPATQTATPVGAPEVLNMFRPTQRRRLRTMLDDLGNGMEDRGASLRAVFVEAVPLLRLAGDLSAELRARRPLVQRLVHNTAVLTGELGNNEEQLRRLLREGSTTLSTLQAGSGDLDATIRHLPGTLTRLDSAMTAVRSVVGDVDGAVTSLYPVADRLPESLAAVRSLSQDATPAVRALQRPVARLVPLARTLPPLSRGLSDAISTLLPQVPTVDKVTKGVAACKKGIQGFFQWNASISKFGDARGAIPRGNVTVGAQSSSMFSDPNEYAPQACSGGKPIGGRLPREGDMR